MKNGYYNFMKKIKFMITIFILMLFYMYVANITLLPENIVLLNEEKLEIKLMPFIEKTETVKTSNENTNKKNIELKLFGKIHLKDMNVDILEDIEVIPIGKVIGLKLYTNGVLIVGLSEIQGENNNISKPYNEEEIKEGDTIIKINNEYVESIEHLKKIVNSSNGDSLNLTLVRDGIIFTSNIIPVKDKENEYKLGLWVKDAATGVGTISFYEPNSKSFAALGHGITDNDTDSLIDIDSGELVTSRILSITKGEKGIPGEVKGTIVNQPTIGNVEKNTIFGIYGTLNNISYLNIDLNKKYKVATRNEIKEGNAKLICSLENNKAQEEYDIIIENIYLNNNSDNKSMLIRVTDEKLIEKTGGIIRGLSGAPIIQNNKFIGVVTNVLVSDPTVGYAIFGDLMIKNLNN